MSKKEIRAVDSGVLAFADNYCAWFLKGDGALPSRAAPEELTKEEAQGIRDEIAAMGPAVAKPLVMRALALGERIGRLGFEDRTIIGARARVTQRRRSDAGVAARRERHAPLAAKLATLAGPCRAKGMTWSAIATHLTKELQGLKWGKAGPPPTNDALAKRLKRACATMGKPSD